MYYKRIFTKSLAHYSYIIGDGQQMAVIDPQPEVDLYLEIARRKNMKISKILETHRNEDFLIGSRALAKLTGADVFVSAHDDLDYQYGEKIEDGHIFELEGIKIKAIHTPGHTLGHMSYLLYFKETPYMIFTGDTCFYGDIGRTDLYGKENVERMTGKIYDSIFNKILPLGDSVILNPAHGPGSACGEKMEERPLSTIGYEKKHNPKLQYSSEEEFIEANANMMFKPDYFSFMEDMNLKGTDSIDCNPNIETKLLKDLKPDEERILDIRSQNDFNKAHIPNSIYIKKEDITNFINWFIDHEKDISIIANPDDDINQVYLDLRRIGYTGNISYLASDFTSWYKDNKVKSIEIVTPQKFKRSKDDYFILDVRKKSETDKEYSSNGIVIPMEDIRSSYKKLEGKENILVVCPSGIRSNIVASYLQAKGIEAKLLIGGLEEL